MDSFVGEIKIWSFDWPPKGWALCDGTLLGISQNQALYALLSNTFGGAAPNTFGLPDLRGRTPVHPDNMTCTQGQRGGQESVALTQSQMPAHNHRVNVYANASPTLVANPAGQFLSQPTINLYNTAGASAPLADSSVALSGGNMGHDNMQPFTVLNFCIALTGIFPPRN